MQIGTRAIPMPSIGVRREMVRTGLGVDAAQLFQETARPVAQSSVPPSTGSSPSRGFKEEAGSTSTIDTARALLERPSFTGAQSASVATDGVRRSVSDVYGEADGDADGKLSKDEFVKFDALMRPNGSMLTEAATGRRVDGEYMYPLLDRDQKGYVTLEQVMAHGYLVPEERIAGGQ